MAERERERGRNGVGERGQRTAQREIEVVQKALLERKRELGRHKRLLRLSTVRTLSERIGLF